MGHAIRSGVVIQQLRKKYDIIACTSGRAYDYLRSLRIPTKGIGGFPLHYSNNRVLHTKSFLSNLLRAPREIIRSLFLLKLIDELKPIAIISDFEPFTAYSGIIKHVPVLSIDNQHLQTYTTLFNAQIRADRTIAAMIIAAAVPRATHYFILSLVAARLNNEHATVLKPIIRKQFFTLTPRQKNYFFAYQTSPDKNTLLEALRRLPFRFIVYGFHKNATQGNIILRSFNEKQFLRDLADCSAVITGGNFGLLSEALFLGKPVYCIPVEHPY